MLDFATQFDGELILRTHRPFSNDELEQWSNAIMPYRVEVLPDQSLLVMSPVSSQFDSLNLDLTTELNLWARSNGSGMAFGPTAGFLLPDQSILSPDAAWLLRERFASLSPKPKSYIPLCPDFIAELRSPSDRLEGQSPAALFRKMDAWMQNGARLAWLIDPIDEQAYVYRPGLPVELVASFDSTLSGEAVLPGFELPLSRLRLPA